MGFTINKHHWGAPSCIDQGQYLFCYPNVYVCCAVAQVESAGLFLRFHWGSIKFFFFRGNRLFQTCKTSTFRIDQQKCGFNHLTSEILGFSQHTKN